MGLFDKLRKGADEPDDHDRSSPPPRPEQRPPAPPPPDVLINLADPPTHAAAQGPTAASPNKLKRFGYDPEAPGQTPVSGIDLITFATVTRQLRDLPVDHHQALLEDLGHTTESWSAVRTAWMARMGQLPFLCDVYEAAYRSA
jgi:hypothetical protein